MNSVILGQGRDKAIKHRHPWIFSGAVSQVEGNPANGEPVEVLDAQGHFLGIGAYSPHSQIRVRMWTFRKEAIDQDFFAERITASLLRREFLRSRSEDTAWRIIHAESDLLPGLVVDQYDRVLAVQFLSSGAEFHRNEIVSELTKITGLSCICERSDVEVRRLEGLPLQSGWIQEECNPEIHIQENGLRFRVNLVEGQKTGFYLDQRENRKKVGLLCKDKDVLNVFSYTGGFSIYAAANPARSIVSVDSSESAQATARYHFELNNLSHVSTEWILDDAFQTLRRFRKQNRKFDVVILDPPKLAATASQVQKAARAYKDLNMQAFGLLQPGGFLATFSCSGSLSEPLFQKIVSDAALDAGVNAVIVERLQQGPDHPVGLNFPEGAYLKGFLCLRD